MSLRKASTPDRYSRRLGCAASAEVATLAAVARVARPAIGPAPSLGVWAGWNPAAWLGDGGAYSHGSCGHRTALIATAGVKSMHGPAAEDRQLSNAGRPWPMVLLRPNNDARIPSEPACLADPACVQILVHTSARICGEACASEAPAARVYGPRCCLRFFASAVMLPSLLVRTLYLQARVRTREDRRVTALAQKLRRRQQRGRLLEPHSRCFASACFHADIKLMREHRTRVPEQGFMTPHSLAPTDAICDANRYWSCHRAHFRGRDCVPCREVRSCRLFAHQRSSPQM